MNKKKKKNMPPVMRRFRMIMGIVKYLYPPLAAKMAHYAFFTPIRYQTPEREKEALSKATLHKETLNNKSLIWYEWGSGPTILLIHGWSGRASQYYKWIDTLCLKGYHVVSFDAPGHGASEGKSSNLFEYADSIMLLASKFSHIYAAIGHSLGGTALLVAQERGLVVQKRVIIATPLVAEHILEVSRLQMNTSKRAMKAVRFHMERQFKAKFEYFTAFEVAQRSPWVDSLIIYDDSDQEAPLVHGNMLKEVWPKALFKQTKGLGHTRILRDDDLVLYTSKWIDNTGISE